MERRSIAVSGLVQGVGFRPFVFRLATRLGLGGFVRNGFGRVLIEVEGAAEALDRFVGELTIAAPAAARIEQVEVESRAVRGERWFRIEPSDGRGAAAGVEPLHVSPDLATCEECLVELFDPRDRRHRYAFLNCTRCGPRLTIVTGAPYDRERTTMSGFAMCAACRAEYEEPRDRRFHAQPVACPACGPRLVLRDAAGRSVAGDPLRGACELLRGGRIVAVKGLGGYHLACDARSAAAVNELRRRKRRDEKPFAVMVRDVAGAERLCCVSPAERGLLESAARPIVLLRKRGGGPVAGCVAPGNPQLGVLLPYTPLHSLLLEELAGMPLVMTSGNQSDEPIACEDGDAVARLGGIADAFLTHDRAIHVRCEDSVVRIAAAPHSVPDAGSVRDAGRLDVVFLRRSRGYAPGAIRLPVECPCPVLAVGGQLKGTFALGRGGAAIVSHHLGDLDEALAFRAFVKDVALYEELFAVAPEIVVHDLHPEYASTRYALARAAGSGAEDACGDARRAVAVQHHHAHMASCMAEHGLCGPVIGVTFDGSGYGLDGAVWGGEFLVGDLAGFERAAHLRYVGLPGGDRAVREPWRMGVAHLADAGVGCAAFERRLSGLSGLSGRRSGRSGRSGAAVRVVRRMLERGVNTPPTSSVGRLFDAVAALCGVRDSVSYEGQAAMELEWLATPLEADGAYPFELSQSRSGLPGGTGGVKGGVSATGIGPARQAGPTGVDTRPLIAAIADDVCRGVDAARIARRFHTTLAGVIVAVCERIRHDCGWRVCERKGTGTLADAGFRGLQHVGREPVPFLSQTLSRVVLSGGVFTNALLSAETAAALGARGFEVFEHRLVPAGDGGLSLGQLAVAAARLAETDAPSPAGDRSCA